MLSVSDDDVRKRLLEKPRFELAAKVVLSLVQFSSVFNKGFLEDITRGV